MSGKRLALSPAYGRKYDTVEQIKKDWEEGKDFKIVGGPYCSFRDKDRMKAMGFTSVSIGMGKVSLMVVL